MSRIIENYREEVPFSAAGIAKLLQYGSCLQEIIFDLFSVSVQRVFGL